MLQSFIPSPVLAAVAALAATLATPAAATVTIFDVSGIDSNDSLGAPINEVFFLDIGANALVTGLGWDVVLFADSPSWLSEMAVTFGSSNDPFILTLRPGVGDDFPGFGAYSSGGIVDLVSLGFAIPVGADGLLRLEYWETLVDYPNDWDGIWVAGELAIRHTHDGVIPEPHSWAMMIAGFGLVGVAARRRRKTVSA
jgi:hypothetical protein